MTDINSREWWENSFKNHWEAASGKEQTEFFCRLALEHLPDWLKAEIRENRLSLCDAGCAEGQGTSILSSYFSNSEVVGIDFSDEAIGKAKGYFPNVNFMVQDIYHLPKKFDVVYCSNTLEHFRDPFSLVDALQKNTDKYLIILVPYQEYQLCESHFFTFDAGTFPDRLNTFIMVYSKIIDSGSYPGTLWGGQQFLVVYKHNSKCNS